MFESVEVYFLIGAIFSVVIAILTPFGRTYIKKFYNFLVRKLGKETADLIMRAIKSLIKYLINNKDKIKTVVSKKSKGKVSKKDLDSFEDGYKKGKDITK
ncbi:hypothetical protein [Virgibacillus sp. SK37]|uniref:hypothetical protein n=1 Tax=Virgibacillus sp. SK37 TaxID=403957 RepID=UPI0004D1AF43|nr:hypothetical protein [Virgibacillus sp. SK37]AIF45636.1 hypothetical protein X953_18765 [Virgibacillus sp. SK37]